LVLAVLQATHLWEVVLQTWFKGLQALQLLSSAQTTVGTSLPSVGQVKPSGAQMPQELQVSPSGQVSAVHTHRWTLSSHVVWPSAQPEHWSSELQLFSRQTPLWVVVVVVVVLVVVQVVVVVPLSSSSAAVLPLPAHAARSSPGTNVSVAVARSKLRILLLSTVASQVDRALGPVAGYQAVEQE